MFYLGHYANITLFYHVHEVNGQLYCHSHFFWLGDDNGTSKRFPLPSHSHTTGSYNLIESFNHVQFVNDLSIPSVVVFLNNYIKIESSRPYTSIILTAHDTVGLRAPPAC